MPELIRAKGCVDYDANNAEPSADNSAFRGNPYAPTPRVNDLAQKNPKAINLAAVRLGAEK